MKLRLSHTRASTFKSCSQKDYLKYKLKIYPKEQGASLDFGSSIDVALAYLLKSKLPNALYDGLLGYKDVFENDSERGWNLAFDDSTIHYRRADYDSLVVSGDNDQASINTWGEELGVSSFDALAAEKTSKYKRFDGNLLKMFNRLCWLSMLRKGHLMLDAFVRDIMPKIKRVIAVQHEVNGNIDENTEVIGIIDLICEFEGYPVPIVFDIKTSAQPYDSYKALFSEQLLLYLGATREELKTSYVGFLVMLKNMTRKHYCSKCGIEKNSKHQTCPVEKNGVRCNGDWKDVPVGETQIQIESIPKAKTDAFLTGLSNLAEVIKLDKPYPNYERCHDYGMCDYFALCHYGDKSKYKFPEDRKLPVINEEKKQ